MTTLTKRMREIVAVYRQEGKFVRVAKHLGITPSAVSRTIRKYETLTGEQVAKKSNTRPRKRISARMQEIVSAYQKEKSLRKTALKVGLTPQAVHDMLTRYQSITGKQVLSPWGR